MLQTTERRFHVYAGRVLVLAVCDKPGTLRSSAMFGPLPPHPFVDAQAYDAASEHQLRTILNIAESFDDYLQRLVQAGFDLAYERYYTLGPGHRITIKGVISGALWPDAGTFSCLAWPTSKPKPSCAHALLTAYTQIHADILASTLVNSASFSDLTASIEAEGWALTPLGRIS